MATGVVNIGVTSFADVNQIKIEPRTRKHHSLADDFNFTSILLEVIGVLTVFKYNPQHSRQTTMSHDHRELINPLSLQQVVIRRYLC